MSRSAADDTGDITRSHVAKGASLAIVARLGALIEIVAQPAYTWMFGIANYGIYVVLWAAVSIGQNLLSLSMTSALQRVVPTENESDAHAAVKLALIYALVPCCLLALGVSIFAEPIAALLSAAPEDRATLPLAVAIFAWALPLWTIVEITTAAMRARRAFGPEIRLRIFWEQVVRLIFAVALFALGVRALGLVLAHMLSLGITSVLAVRLLGRYYDLTLILRAPMRMPVAKRLLASGLAALPPEVARRLFTDLPPIILNLMLPGARGATAAGLFGVARKIASVPLIVRQAFSYVLAPLASAQAKRDRAGLGPIYSFATRVSAALVIPLAGFIILAAGDILSLFAPGAEAAVPVVVILTLARVGESVVGPAAAVLEMIGHRGLPLLNSTIGIVLWMVLGWMLVPTHGATGMAVAVGLGAVVMAMAAAVELRITEGLVTFDRKTVRGIAAAVGCVALMALAGAAAAPLGRPPRAILLLLLLPLAGWVALRVGLSSSDRAALGRTGRRLRLSGA